MKTRTQKRLAAVSMIEVLMVLAALLVLAAIFLPALMRRRHPSTSRAPRIQCVNNLKQIGLAYRVWEGDNNDTYPMFVSQTNGGSMEFTNGANAWRHFQVMSNELSTPKILFCPVESDANRICANTFGGMPGPNMFMSNSNVSFFVGIVSNEMNPELILSGDHNLTNGTAVKNGMLELTASQPLGWTREMHNQLGNIGLADGSVQQVGNTALRSQVASSGAATDLIQMPVLAP